MRSRRWKLIALLAALMLVFAACGDDDDDTTAPAEDGEEEPADGAAALEEGPGFDGSTISVGMLTPQTGPVAIIGNPLTAGHEVYWAKVNAEGGVAGQYPVELVVRDSQYADDVTVQRYNEIKDQVVMFGQILGTPPTQAVLPLLEQDNIVGAPASLDAEWVREQHLLPIGGPYQIQMINAAAYYIEEGGGEGTTICAFAQDDAYGDAGLEGLEFAAQELEFEIATVTRYARGDTSFTAQVGELEGSGCEAVFMVSTPAETAGLVKEAIGRGFAPRWIGQSPVWINVFPALVGDAAYLQENMWVVAEGTEWGDESIPGAAEMLADIEQYKPDQEPDYYFAFGYNQARAVHQVLEAAVENGDLSRDGIIEAMNGVETLTFGDLSGDYEYGPPEDRNPPRGSTLFQVDPAKPFSLGLLSEPNFVNPLAEEYEF